MTNRRSLLRSATAVAALAFAPAMAAADELPVVATFSILGDMVAQIGGEHISLTTLVGPDGDTHVYQPTPQDARAVQGAEVLFMNGLEFEGWMDRLAEASDFAGATVVATTGIDAIEYDDHDDHHDDHDDHDDHGDEDHDHGDDHGAEEASMDKDHDHDHGEEHDHDHDHGDDHGAEEASMEEDHDHDHDHGEEHAKEEGHDHDHDHGAEEASMEKDHDHDDHGHDHAGHDHGEFDPHAWQSIDAAIIYANNIAAGLSQADPENAGDYFANRAAFVAELEALDAEITAMMEAIPEDQRTIVTSHDAFGYFARDYGLTFMAPQGQSTESEASAADVAALITQIREDGIDAVFVESVVDSRLIQQIANETGAT
ncbi:MAG: metal ABC transporter solute-binding protein, Zn/Mn family, partial [Shimia sp.]